MSTDICKFCGGGDLVGLDEIQHRPTCPVVASQANREERICAALERIAKVLEDELWKIADNLADYPDPCDDGKR